MQTYALIDDPVTSAPPPAGITLNADGTLSVAGTVAPGSHTVTYRICRTDTLPQPLCATAQASGTAKAPFGATDKGPTAATVRSLVALLEEAAR